MKHRFKLYFTGLEGLFDIALGYFAGGVAALFLVAGFSFSTSLLEWLVPSVIFTGYALIYPPIRWQVVHWWKRRSAPNGGGGA